MGRSSDLLFGNPKIDLYCDEQQMTEEMSSQTLCHKTSFGCFKCTTFDCLMLERFLCGGFG